MERLPDGRPEEGPHFLRGRRLARGWRGSSLGLRLLLARQSVLVDDFDAVERKGKTRDLVWRRRLLALGEFGDPEQQQRPHALDGEARCVSLGAGAPPLSPVRCLVTDLLLHVDQAANARGEEVVDET